MTISAKVIADSISPQGVRITTFELEYPRFIHAEFMTHRLFSRNAASSRAIPVDKAIELIIADTAAPIHWGKNQPGMSAKEECDAPVSLTPGAAFANTRRGAWEWARDQAIFVARAFAKAGYHKQIVNRLLEPFTHIKVVLTATEYDNWFWLRKHPDAQPEIQRLAEVMWEVREASTPVALKEGDWHVPYYRDGYWRDSGYVRMSHPDLPAIDSKYPGSCTLEEALAISSSCCAQVSYRRLDDTLEKAMSIFQRLVESKPVHASPFEHQATPLDWNTGRDGEPTWYWADGISHTDRMNIPWSGNFRGWIQHRQLIPDNTCWKYEG